QCRAAGARPDGHRLSLPGALDIDAPTGAAAPAGVDELAEGLHEHLADGDRAVEGPRLGPGGHADLAGAVEVVIVHGPPIGVVRVLVAPNGEDAVAFVAVL